MLATAELLSPIRLDPRARRLIPKLSFAGAVADLDPAEVRRSYNRTRQPYAWPLESVGNITPIARGHDGTPALRIFRPQISSAEAADSYLFFHGGGWTLGDLAIYEPLCRRLANRLNANIIWVEYRLAPEHPFPAALDDAAAAVLWFIKNAESLGLAPDRLSLIGDSAGANIAAVLALLNRRGEYGLRFRRQVLIYPCLDLTASYPSHHELAEGYLLTRDLYGWYRQNYVQNHDPTDWRLSPLFAAGLKEAAPAVILRAGFDPLRDEAKAYGQRLRLAGVPVQEIYFPEMLHGFVTMGAVFPQAESAIEQIKRGIRRLGD
ncbi:alpha/beta hydrolase [Aestuariivirga sp. YIM B02566]|uniref:Alpha/beta hydrolase n=1 Tax=Taklimakanibacter albus TaxID=2800327 RepID=A0ACC5R3I9_9HYPH|nr:alpha/beta hydrolase [Aestuariivirga sp. YIM B02566]MBK1867180.1 alpha/beta hydrolase [Aestuariivirga sp. YIM B02566]